MKLPESKRLRWLGILCALMAVWLSFIGPWPVDYAPLATQAYYRQAQQAISAQFATAPQSAPLQAGFAANALVLAKDLPLAGYGKRRGASATGQRDPIRVKATALRLQNQTVILLGADLLFVSQPVAAKLRQQIKQRHQAEVYFVATHTHSGPGAWGKNSVERLVTGALSADFIAQLQQLLLTTTAQALANLQPAKLGLGQVQAPAYVKNRLLNKAGAPVDARLQWVQFAALANDRLLGTLVSYGAHATTLGAKNLQFSADYPGTLERSLEAHWQSPVYFCAGPVGSQSPVRLPGQAYQAMGLALAAKIKEGTIEWFAPPYRFHIAHLALTLPPLQYRISENLRLAPWITHALLDMGPDSYLSVIHIGPWAALGMPTELSGEIALQLYPVAQQRGMQLWLTPFNGDYVGYVVPDKYYKLDRYETRAVNTLGPYGGGYMEGILRQILLHL